MAPLSRLSTALAERLQARRNEIEQATMTRVNAIGGAVEARDPQYAEGLRVAVGAAIDYGIESITGGDRVPSIPVQLLEQARFAAWHGVSLDTVIRRYVAGHSLLSEFMIEEAGPEGGLRGEDLNRLLRRQVSLLDRILATVAEEYGRESRRRARTVSDLLADRVDKLLAGERADAPDLGYAFDCWHVAVLAEGGEVEDRLRALVNEVDCRLLLIGRGEGSAWAWVGTRKQLDPRLLIAAAMACGDGLRVMGVGEAGFGLTGWRLSHRQASAALLVCRRRGDACARYGDVVRLASILRDETATASLRQLYLAPLEQQRDGGAIARETLRAYLAARCNVSSAAAALGVNRNTVANRLRTVEETIGRPLASCIADVDAALQLDELPKPTIVPET